MPGRCTPCTASALQSAAANTSTDIDSTGSSCADPFRTFCPLHSHFNFAQQGAASLTSALPSQCSAPSISLSHRDLLPLTVAPAAPPLIPIPPRTAKAFLQARTTPSPTTATTAAAESEALLQAIATLKGSLQVTTAGQEAVKADAVTPLPPPVCRLQRALPRPPECAARVRALINCGDAYSGQVWPQLRSSEACTSVHDWYRWRFLRLSAAFRSCSRRRCIGARP